MNKEDLKTAEEILLENGYDPNELILFKNPNYDNALIGITDTNQLVYDFDLMIEYLTTFCDEDEESAADFICWNDSFFYGSEYPLVYYGEEDDLEELDEEDRFPEFKRFNLN